MVGVARTRSMAAACLALLRWLPLLPLHFHIIARARAYYNENSAKWFSTQLMWCAATTPCRASTTPHRSAPSAYRTEWSGSGQSSNKNTHNRAKHTRLGDMIRDQLCARTSFVASHQRHRRRCHDKTWLLTHSLTGWLGDWLTGGRHHRCELEQSLVTKKVKLKIHGWAQWSARIVKNFSSAFIFIFLKLIFHFSSLAKNSPIRSRAASKQATKQATRQASECVQLHSFFIDVIMAWKCDVVGSYLST